MKLQTMHILLGLSMISPTMAAASHAETPHVWEKVEITDAKPGSDKAARYCRSAMYGSVLSGGLGGHIYGAGGWKGGLWSGEVEAASEYPIWGE